MSTSSDIRLEIAAPHRRGRPVGDWVGRYWQWLPVLPAALYLVGFFANLGSLLRSLYSVADWTSLLYIGQVLPSLPHTAHVVMWDFYLLEILGFEVVTRHLPGYHTLWEIVPWIAGALVAGMLGRLVSKVSGRWAGMIVFFGLLCTNAPMLQWQFEWDGHSSAYQTIVVLGAVIPLIALRGGVMGRSRPAWWLWLALATLVAAGGIADDPLFLMGGFVPFLIASAVIAWLSKGEARSRTLISVGTIAVGAVVLGELAKVVARREGLELVADPLALGPYNQILDHIGLWFQSLLSLMGGDFGGRTVGLRTVFELLGAVAIAGGLYVAARCVVRQVRALLLGRGILPGTLDQGELARVALIVYWAAGAVLLTLVFVFSSAVVDIQSNRYAVPVAYAIVVLVAVTAAPHPWARNLTAAGAAVLILSSAFSVFQHDIQNIFTVEGFPTPGEAKALKRWAQRNHLKYGYASYWEAAPLSWMAGSGIGVYPVDACGTGTLCADGQRVQYWYRPRPHTRTFVVVDERFQNGDTGAMLGVDGPPSAFGRPQRVAHVGPLTVYVYGYDVASRFGPPQTV